MATDEAERDEAPVDDRTPEEREASRARIRAWFANLPAELAQVYEELKRLDPKGEPRKQQ